MAKVFLALIAIAFVVLVGGFVVLVFHGWMSRISAK
jgi:hypothetical protein